MLVAFYFHNVVFCWGISYLQLASSQGAEMRILGAFQGRSTTVRGGVAEFFTRKISVTVRVRRN